MAERDDGFSDRTTVARPKFTGAPSSFAFVLEVIEGPSRGARISVDASSPSRVLVGKGPLCELRLDDIEVSRRHFALEVSGQRLIVTDLASTNGTSVNGLPIGVAYLSGGELIHAGASALRVHVQDASSAAPLPAADHFGRVIGGSSAMRRIYPLCQRLAASNVSIVLEGETGTGKEQLAEALHELGPRAAGPFVVLDCTALAPSLIESELFGHERGAFTGAVSEHRGVFERAHGGTLFIDEIGDLPIELQPKLLRAIERSEVTRLGGMRALSVQSRLILATRRDLDHEVLAGRFRDDLFHRIAVARIELPPLRARGGDVELLACHFAGVFGGDPTRLPDELLARWADAPWPGNVRELRNAVLRWLALGDLGGEAELTAPSDHARATPGGVAIEGDTIARILALDLPLAEARDRVVEEFERRFVTHLLSQHDGNVTRAAAAAGVARRHLHRLIAKRT